MRAYLDLVATCAALAFLLLIVWPAYDYAYEESFITTPALQIPTAGAPRRCRSASA
jgi:TRAP-type C4-dicarboxylate transport system permease small subunit